MLLEIVKQIVAKNGEQILFDSKRINAFFLDLAKDEPKLQKRAFIESLEYGVVKTLKGVAKEERINCKEMLAQKLHAEEGLDVVLYRNAIDILCEVLFGRVTDIFDLGGMVRERLCLFFVVDTSIGMVGNKISAVNVAIEELLPELEDFACCDNIEIMIDVLAFSTEVHWITNNAPIEWDKFHWNPLAAAGFANFGKACMALKERLNDEHMSKRTLPPKIILFSNGEFTDNWQTELAKLKENGWFKIATKIAVAISMEANMDELKAFTDYVIDVHDIETLQKMICRIPWDDIEMKWHLERCRESIATTPDNNQIATTLDSNQEDWW
jgi:uncharacterized protein YegL